jgi:hypothetical protein
MLRFATTKDAWAAIKAAKLDVFDFSLAQDYRGGDYQWRIEKGGQPIKDTVQAQIELAVLDIARKAVMAKVPKPSPKPKPKPKPKAKEA